MSEKLSIEADWEALRSGTPQERATFAAIGIAVGDHWLTRADDVFTNRLRDKVYLSAYRLAEWIVWNWWRLRWEPFARRELWAFAHRMTTIGGGFVWPNISIYSDVEQIIIEATPTTAKPEDPLRYIESWTVAISAIDFEAGVDSFIQQVVERLRAERVAKTNLDAIWDELKIERSDQELARWRRFEALLGF